MHLAFLFGEHDLGKEMIQKAVEAHSQDEASKIKYRHRLVNTAYTSDLVRRSWSACFAQRSSALTRGVCW